MHPVDRFFYHFRRPFIILGIIAIPIALLAYVALFRTALEHWPAWQVAGAIIAHFITALSLGLPAIDRSKDQTR